MNLLRLSHPKVIHLNSRKEGKKRINLLLSICAASLDAALPTELSLQIDANVSRILPYDSCCWNPEEMALFRSARHHCNCMEFQT